MGPALSSVTSLVAKLPSVTKVLSFIYKHSLVKLLGNPVSKFTTSHICAVTQKLCCDHPLLIFRKPTCSPRASSPPPWGPPGAPPSRRSRPPGSSTSRPRLGPAGPSGRSREERAGERAEIRGQTRGRQHQLQRWDHREQGPATNWRQLWENRNITSWEMSVQLVLTLVKWA